jgi:DNA invertase Pin-like site-specific DNA recombinase
VKAAVYLRVSTHEQDEAHQEPECLKLCAGRGWDPIIYREQVSAVKHRPQWDALKTAVHRGEVGAVVLWALDRAGRNRVQLAHDIAEFTRKGAVVASVRESWIDQPVGPLRDLLIQLMGWFAESERARLIERTKAGQATARARGVHIGRPVLALEKQHAIERAWLGGQSAWRAAQRLGVPESTVRTYFRRWEAKRLFHATSDPRKVWVVNWDAKAQKTAPSGAGGVGRDK